VQINRYTFFIKLCLSVIFSVFAQPSTTISLKLIRPFPYKHVLCALVIHRFDLYPLVCSFKTFLLSGALFLVACLLLCMLVTMIDAHKVNAIREALKSVKTF
jgi:hypothetical protein